VKHFIQDFIRGQWPQAGFSMLEQRPQTADDFARPLVFGYDVVAQEIGSR